jgi:ectoine hydroxylase-related dioxygenase (phytanoyl-CoA dioxygenase family)
LAAPYAICLFLPLIDLTDETGYTQFWPGSHRSRHWAGFGPVAKLAHLTYNGLVQTGDAIFYDYRLWHRGMPNRTADTVRPVLQVIFKRSWYIERANYGTEPIVPAE